MKSKSSALFILFWLVAIADMAIVLFSQTDWRWFTKPLLMPILMLAVWSGVSNRDNSIKLILAALFFSWAGDILLQMEGMFIPGLVSFLTAHLFYIYYFLKIKSDSKGLVEQKKLLIGMVLIYVIGFLSILFPHLGAMKIPVVLYALTIGTMLLTALNTKYKISDSAAQLFILGATCFVLSDSLLAFNLFVSKYLALSFLIMLTYCAAQYLIVRGAIEHRNL